jgi:Asp/Glu/hydantoin racemase
MPDIIKETQSPTYYIEQYLWETGPLTILNLEYLVNKKEPLGKVASKLCILYGAHNDKLKAYALACYGPPQLLHLNETALKLVDDGIPESVFLHCRVHIANKVAYIPSLEKLEEIVLQQL